MLNFGAGYGNIPIPYLATYPEINIKSIKEREKLIGFRGHLNDSRIKLKEYSVEDRLDSSEYFEELNNTILSLCPQGCDNSSYRLYESIHTGAIPIYISDNHFLPFSEIIDYNKFMFLLKWDELDKLKDIQKLNLDVLQNMQNEVIKHKKYFTYKYTYNYIIDYINERF